MYLLAQTETSFLTENLWSILGIGAIILLTMFGKDAPIKSLIPILLNMLQPNNPVPNSPVPNNPQPNSPQPTVDNPVNPDPKTPSIILDKLNTILPLIETVLTLVKRDKNVNGDDPKNLRCCLDQLTHLADCAQECGNPKLKTEVLSLIPDFVKLHYPEKEHEH